MAPEPAAAELSEEFNDLSVRAWLRLGWRGFNRWRKRYWLTRVIILLLIFSPALAEMVNPRGPLITQLVRIAIHAMQLATEPRVAYELARSYRVGEMDRLRLSLRRELDEDRDGLLSLGEEARARTASLNPEQLTCPVLRADLEELAGGAKALGLVPASYSAAQVRRQTWYAAQAEAQRFFAPSHRDVEAILGGPREWPDYTKWETWRDGIGHFYGGVSLLLGRWVPVCFLGAGLLSLAFRRGRPTAGFFAAFVVAAGLLGALWGPLHDIVWEGEQGYLEMAHCAGWALLASVVGYAGGKAAAHVTHRSRVALGAIALLGILVAEWGATVGLRRLAARWWYGSGDLSWPSEPVDVRALLGGLALLAIGAAGLYIAARRARRTHRPG